MTDQTDQQTTALVHLPRRTLGQRLRAVLGHLGTAVSTGLLLAALGGVLYVGLQMRRSAVLEDLAETTETKRQLADAEATQDRIDAAQRVREDALAVATARSAEAAGQLREAEQAVAELGAAERAFQTLREELLSGESGRRIAARPQSLQAVESYLADAEPLRDPSAQTLASRPEALAEPIREAAASPTPDYRPSAAITEQIASIEITAAAARQRLTDLTQLLRRAADAAANEAPAATTLRAALDERRLDRVARTAFENAAALQRQRDETARKHAQLNREAERRLADQRLAAMRAESERRQEEQRLLAEKQRKVEEDRIARERAAQREAEAKRAFERARGEITKYLVAFTGDGTTQRGPNAPARPGPMSWGYLQSSGALADTTAGMEKFAQLLNPYTNARSPHAWANHMFYFKSKYWDKKDMSFHYRAQELLREHGEQMMKAGLLAE